MPSRQEERQLGPGGAGAGAEAGGLGVPLKTE